MARAPWTTLYNENPYTDFPLDGWSVDIQGWGHEDPVFRHLVDTVRPQTIIEVGTWKGASAIEMARVAKDLDLAVEIICIDTWLGSPEHFLKPDQPPGESLNMRHGYPRLYDQFLANVLHEGHEDMIVPLAQTSENAAVILRKLGVLADLVYIDAAHEYEPVLADLERYWPLLSARGGVLFGDDFHRSPVADAARDFTDTHGLVLHAAERKFAIARPERALAWPPL
jgi:predicted O-methyltransferase YrrM